MLLLIFFFLSQDHDYALKGQGFTVRLNIPFDDYVYSEDYVEEGTFFDFSFSDTTAITVQCVSNVRRPSMKKNVYKIDTLEIDNQLVYRCLGMKGDGYRYWQEDVYRDIDLSIKIYYRSKENLNKYRNILDKVKIDL
ncbi:hypothetical protein [Reichenbachiella ulvae]|uniref:Uncharacterized protein n=1 Tax=Reichenbachiella ulvae TaxID=2980104 RepID=A0ABT3CUQ7_9BACT|nr:hypothetical protein [Reichenbachiella ulvae]MCV9387432.1 hypothetical protein [Reichenbachiella ulvae]